VHEFGFLHKDSIEMHGQHNIKQKEVEQLVSFPGSFISM
jgi:hypothetical protein